MAKPIILAMLLSSALAAPAAHAAVIEAGTATHGGAVAGGQVIHVTSLADSGTGSLRAAVQAQGPRIIVFDVGGIITLANDLKISIPEVTIAGQTAPAPGITLTGASLRVRAHDVVLQHIAVRPAPAATPEINGNRDAITIGGGKGEAADVRLENVSTSWSVDEDIDVESPTTHNVTIRNSIVAEALRNAGHPKGAHSMGLLINDGPQGVAVTGNLFAADMYRNPAIARGSSAIVAYNYIVDPGRNGIHFYSPERNGVLRAAIIGNIIDAGSDTSSRVTAVQIPDDMGEKSPDAEIYLSNNTAAPGALTSLSDFKLAASPPVALAGADRPPANLRAWVLRYAGARPALRDAVDARIVKQAANLSIHIIDNPSEVGGLPQAKSVTATAEVPSAPFEASGIDGLLRIEAWLCERHLEVGGPPTPECRRSVDDYRKALKEKQA